MILEDLDFLGVLDKLETQTILLSPPIRYDNTLEKYHRTMPSRISS